MKLSVFVHEPLSPTGWDCVGAADTPDEAAAIVRFWGARGWRVLCVSTECIDEGWPIAAALGLA